MDHDRYDQLKVGEKVLWHGPNEGLFEGIVAKREELPGGGVVIHVLAPFGPDPSPEQVVYPGAGDLHAVPFDGTEHCFQCNWHKLHFLAGDTKGPFTGRPHPE
jgi:hypothetical protein